MKLFHLYLEDSLAPPVDFLICTFEDLVEYLNTDQPDKGAVERTARHFDLYRHRVVNHWSPGEFPEENLSPNGCSCQLLTIICRR